MPGTADPDLSERLNRECRCVTLDPDALRAALERESGDPDFFAAQLAAHPHLFSNAPVFLSQAHFAAMSRTVRAIESVARLSAYRETVLSRSPEIARPDFGPRGAFMGYDFHLAHEGPRLIEINTNAGGAFLNALLARAQHACCAEMDAGLRRSEAYDFDAAMARMFEREWRLQRREGAPRLVAVVDDAPQEQHFYPEFVLAQRALGRHGMETLIADARELRFEAGALSFEGRRIDLVYNRLVDFSLEAPEHAALRAAYLAGAAVLTPNPHVYALFADKRNLALLSDPALLRSFGVPEETVAALAGVPRTVPVMAANAEELWRNRRKLFFKPAAGYGSKAVYRGDRMTHKVWDAIRRGDYVAQDYAAPSERVVEVDGAPAVRKTDVRLYVYDGETLLAAARLYRGQATNFRAPGSGFAPVFVV
ncbi:MAG TPA: hypothetical protein VMI74_17065 [Burkholderiales bacterium]|nr:hypothetical protein [Burkholderiales bacterium]